MTLPTPDAQPPRFLSQETNLNHSIPATPVPPSLASTFVNPLTPETENSSMVVRERATDFASHSWDLATGGLKTLTAKRELPPRLERRSTHQLSDAHVTPRSYMFPLVILACIIIMLVSGSIVLFMMIQP